MSSNPEIVEVYVEGEDRATPSLTSVSRSFVLLGANILRVGTYFGLESAAAEKAIQTIMLVGHIGRIVASVKNLLGLASWFAAGAETAQTAATTASTAAMGIQTTLTGVAAAGMTGYAGAATGAAAANVGLAASFTALLASMGPIGWALMGVSALLGALGGFALAGGFGGGKAAPAVRSFGMGEATPGRYQEPRVEITIINPVMSSERDIREQVQDIGTEYWEETRKHRGVG